MLTKKILSECEAAVVNVLVHENTAEGVLKAAEALQILTTLEFAIDNSLFENKSIGQPELTKAVLRRT